MSKVYVIDQNKRINRSDIRSGTDEQQTKDRRDPGHKFIEDKKLEYLFNFLINRIEKYEKLENDKEKKKMLVIASSFTVFSLIVSAALTISNGNLLNKHSIEYASGLISIFIFGIAAINISLVKYIVSLKLECILAVRQINCFRQAINAVVFARIEGHLPQCYDENKKSIEGTILDKNTEYWHLHGKHEKYPLDNVNLKFQYKTWRMFFNSSDYFSVSVIVLCTVGLISIPFIFVLSNLENLQESLGFVFIIGFVAASAMLGALLIVYKSIKSARNDLNNILSVDGIPNQSRSKY